MLLPPLCMALGSPLAVLSASFAQLSRLSLPFLATLVEHWDNSPTMSLEGAPHHSPVCTHLHPSVRSKSPTQGESTPNPIPKKPSLLWDASHKVAGRMGHRAGVPSIPVPTASASCVPHQLSHPLCPTQPSKFAGHKMSVVSAACLGHRSEKRKPKPKQNQHKHKHKKELKKTNKKKKEEKGKGEKKEKKRKIEKKLKEEKKEGKKEKEKKIKRIIIKNKKEK